MAGFIDDNNVEWLTATELAGKLGISVPSVYKRVSEGVYTKTKVGTKSYYADIPSGDGEAVSADKSPAGDFDDMADYELDESDFFQCPQCQSPLTNISEDVKKAIESHTLARINAKTEKINGLVLSSKQLQAQLIENEKKHEDNIKKESQLNAYSDELKARDIQLLEDEAEYAEKMKSLNEAQARLKEEQSSLEKDIESWNSKKPGVMLDIQMLEIEKNKSAFSDYVYDKYLAGVKFNLVMPIGDATYNGKYNLTLKDACDVWNKITEDWPDCEKHRAFVSIS